MKKILLMFSIAITLFGVSTFTYAGLNDFLHNLNIQARTDLNNFNIKLSTQFGVPISDVEAIVKIVAKPSDAFMVFQVGQMAHKEPREVLEAYQQGQGKGWGRLAQEMGIKPGSAEFHALKRGNLHFTGNRDDDRPRQGRVHGKNKEHSKGNGNGHGNGRGRGDD